MVQIEYIKKPSKPMLLAAIRRALNAGETWVQLTWGENQITVERGHWGLDGRGWIGRNSGQDLAADLAYAAPQAPARWHARSNGQPLDTEE